MESSLAAGFETPLIEIIATFVVIAGVILAFTVYSVRKHRHAERLRQAEEDTRYRELVQRYALSRSDEEVISVLAKYLRRNTAAYLLLQSQGLFNQAAALALADQGVAPGTLSSLRVRLGFTGRLLGAQPHSSVDIPPGAAVVLELRRSREIPATVLTAATDTLRVALQSEPAAGEIGAGDGAVREPTPVVSEPRLTPGRTVRVVYQNEAGVFAFESAVLKREGGELSLQHSEDIVSIQKRDHYRKKIRLPVSVSNALSDEEPVPSEFLDIGGGGASLYNPDKRFQPGDSIFLTFPAAGEGSFRGGGAFRGEGAAGGGGAIRGEGAAGGDEASGGDAQFGGTLQSGRGERPRPLDLVATVLRTSRGGRVIHVRYGNIRESDRDRVYRLLFQPPPHGTDPGSSRRSHPS